MWDLLFNWSELVERGADAATYFVLAAVATLLFLIRLGLSMFHGDLSDFDTSLEHGGASDAAFSVFSTLSILAFFMGAGWMGLACRLEWDVSRVLSAICATGFGSVMMLMASGLMYLSRKLNREVNYEVKTAIGRTAKVYLTIPEKGRGSGQVEVVVSGRRKVLGATSTGPTIAAFADVKVVDVRDDETLVVEPL
jgi:hypothetical protein